MNGAVYISFFQGQLESVLEQVVQLAVQEISKTVGSSLNALLLETAAKEKENNRLRLQLQARDSRARSSSEDGGSAAAGKNKAGAERGDGGRTKPEPRGPGAQGGAEPPVPIDTRRLEQRGRAVDQLKSVMERVLDFALRELTKIVEASFDDLLLEITKMEKEQAALEERLGRSGERPGGGGDKGRAGGGGRRRGSENDSVSPSGSSEDTREEPAEESKETAPPSDPQRPPVLSVSQDWVPILDKVFGQKWCSDVWQVKEGGGGSGSGRGLGEGGGHHVDLVSAPSVILQPSPSSPQQDPRWTPLEDMEVFSPDNEDPAPAGAPPPPGPSPGPPPGPSPGPPLSPSGRRSSASMLHRLLTLPSQLLDEDEDEAAAAARETLAALATNGSSDQREELDPPGRSG
ncbi:zinc finger and BTB domain-containing protein 4, partial [Kryptolebias marmoratus]|uniref:zinc finger and BTB domain-containing protein 4 n=1 Tax=Kryptolebias marmoratus TaxID=37003 RepID=UPI000D530485